MSGDPLWPWSVLGLERMPPAAADVRRAYARALKKIDQSKDIEGFAALRAAYEAALAMREKADGRNAERRTARAAARDTEPPEQTAPRPPEPPDATTLAAKAEQAAFTALLQAGLAGDLDEERMLAILDSPFMADVTRRKQIEYAFATAVRAALVVTNGDDGNFMAAFTPRLVRRLDAEFGWLSDYAAFRQAFGSNDAVLHGLMLRANDGLPFEMATAPIRQGWLKRLGRMALSWPALLLLYFGAKAANDVRTATSADSSQALSTVALVITGLAICLGLMRLGLYLYGLYRLAFHSHTASLAFFLTLLVPLTCLPLYGPAQQTMYGAGLCLALCLLLAFSVGHRKTGLRLENWLRSVARRF